MNLNLRWQSLLVLTGLALVVVLLSYRSPQPAPAVPETLPVIDPAELSLDDAGCQDPAAVRGGFLAEGMIGRPQTINPLLSDHNPVDQTLAHMIFKGLTRLDTRGSVVADLAEGWEISEDRLSVVFTLRSDARWHDGEPVTAEDVLFTVQLLQDPLINERLDDGPLWASVAAEKVADRQVRFTLPAPYAPFLEAAGRGLLPAHLLSGVGAADLINHPFNSRPVGTGPFQVRNNWGEDGFVLLSPVAGSWATPPLLDGLQIRFYADETALVDAYSRGEIQAAPLTPAITPEVMTMAGSRLFTGHEPVYTQLIFNLSGTGSTPISSSVVTNRSLTVSDLAVRQALALGLDKQLLVDRVLNGQGLPFEGPYLPDSWAYDPFMPHTYAVDPAAAGDALTADGWIAGGDDGRGIRQKTIDETVVALSPVLLILDENRPRQVAQDIAAQWALLGVEVTIDAVNRESYFTRLQQRDFDITLVDVAVPEDPDLYDFWSQEAIIRGQNYAGWNNRRASEALEAGRQVWGQEERRQFYRAFLTFYDQDLPAITLFQHVNNYGVRDTIQGVNIGPNQENLNRYQTFNRWYFQSEDDDSGCEDGTTG